MRTELRQAYELLAKFKRGALGESEISDEQGRLFEVLKADLDVKTPETNLTELAKLVAIADSYWNHQTQMTIAKYYGALAEGSPGHAKSIRESFFGKCPSVWYREIVGDL